MLSTPSDTAQRDNNEERPRENKSKDHIPAELSLSSSIVPDSPP